MIPAYTRPGTGPGGKGVGPGTGPAERFVLYVPVGTGPDGRGVGGVGSPYPPTPDGSEVGFSQLAQTLRVGLGPPCFPISP